MFSVCSLFSGLFIMFTATYTDQTLKTICTNETPNDRSDLWARVFHVN